MTKEKPLVTPDMVKLSVIRACRYSTVVAVVPEHPELGMMPILITEISRSKYKPHTGEKQRIKEVKRALKNRALKLDLEVE